MEIVILFIGLIVHVNQPWSFDNTAVLPRAPEHVAELIVPYDEIVGPDSWIERQRFGANRDQVRINLDGIDVRIRGTRGIFCDVNRDFLESVPPMRLIGDPTCGRLRPEVRQRKQGPGSAIAAYVDYRGGGLEPAGFAPNTLAFPSTPDWAEGRCVACSARYVGKLRGSEATLAFTEDDGTVRTVKIKAGAELIVQNVPSPNMATRVAMRHFDHHYAVFREGRCADNRIPEVRPTRCGKEQCQVTAASGVSTTTPGDDCTIVRYP